MRGDKLMTGTGVKTKLNIKTQTVYTVGAIIAAVLLPQIVHVLGAKSGVGSALGEIFLPMHLPVILAGLLAGPFAGAVSGAVSPVISFALTGMPKTAMLPFMVTELAAYGLFAGLLKNVKMPCVLKVLLTQIAGRAVRAAAILTAVKGFGYGGLKLPVIWNSITAGLIGIALQLLIIPLVVYRVQSNER